MSTHLQSSPSPAQTAAGWALLECDQVDSTNARAARLPAWSAVTARTQTAGRGRHDRRWVSDAGGLWLSAVVPLSDDPHRWSILPLAAGWAACHALSSMGIAGLRLRWPNDVMIAQAKLAGILVERFTAATAVVGIGINGSNRPEAAEPALAGAVARTADLAPAAASLPSLRDAVLDALRRAHAWIAAGTPGELSAALAPFWRHGPVAVTLRPQGAVLAGTFTGIDPAGRLGLRIDEGPTSWLAPADVELLREIF